MWNKKRWCGCRWRVCAVWYLLLQQDARPPWHICGWTDCWNEQLRTHEDLPEARNYTISNSLQAMWKYNKGRFINHFVNHHRGWIGESWRNIYVGSKNTFPAEVFMETVIEKLAALTETGHFRNSVCPFSIPCFTNTFQTNLGLKNWELMIRSDSEWHGTHCIKLRECNANLSLSAKGLLGQADHLLQIHITVTGKNFKSLWTTSVISKSQTAGQTVPIHLKRGKKFPKKHEIFRKVWKIQTLKVKWSFQADLC